ncbi:magnesium transporter, partial [Vibrio parahaemolyticus]|nr:magnesium transporter [Vibrio parahaemolyticus]
DVARRCARRNGGSAPVGDDNQPRVGRITLEAVIDVIREDAEHSMLSMAGMDDDAAPYAPDFKSARTRSVWLGANVLAALAAA